MSNNRKLKQRITSVKSTQKITQVMRLISTSYVRRISGLLKSSDDVLGAVATIRDKLVVPQDINRHPLLNRARKVKARLYVVVTSNKGLCGYYNNSVVKACMASISKSVARGEECKIICIGNKGHKALSKRYPKNTIESVNILYRGKLCSMEEVQELAERLVNNFIDGTVDAVDMAYTQFKGGSDMPAVVESLLPIHVQAAESNDSLLYDTDRDEVLEMTLKHYLSAFIYNAIANSYLSEENSRMVAMDGAVRNTEKLVSNLNVMMNKSRQATITNTLIDVVNSSEAA